MANPVIEMNQGLIDAKERMVKANTAAKAAREADDKETYETAIADFEAAEKEASDIAGDIERQRKINEADAALAPIDDAGNTGVETGLPPREQRFGSLAEQCIAIRDATTNAGVDPRLEIVAAAAGAGSAIDSDGGYLIQKDLSNEILRRMYDLGEIIGRVRDIPVSGNGLKIPYVNETSRVTGSRLGGIRGYYVDEGIAPTTTKTKIGKMDLELHKIAALGYMTEELMSDAPAMSELLTQGFAEELLFMRENEVISGTGGGQAQGILNADCLVTVTKETGQAAATVLFENLSKMWARCYARSRRNAVWFINQDIEPQLDLLSVPVGTGGIPVYLPAGGIADTPFARLKGRPVIPVEYCETLGTVGDIILADLSQYITISKDGLKQASSIHVRFTTDEIAFRATIRTDGQASWQSALTPFKGTATISPFVALATRA